jgi:hypothetical protein
LILDVYELKEQKRYIYCILNLAQPMESFLSYSIKVRLIWQPFKNGVIKDKKEFNLVSSKLSKLFEVDTLSPLKSLFFKIYLNQIHFSSNCEIDDFLKKYGEYKNYKPSDEEIKKYPDLKTVNLFLKLRNTKFSKLRSKVVHKLSYRPTLQEVEECFKETRDIVFGLAARLEVKDHLYYLSNRNI